MLLGALIIVHPIIIATVVIASVKKRTGKGGK